MTNTYLICYQNISHKRFSVSFSDHVFYLTFGILSKSISNMYLQYIICTGKNINFKNKKILNFFILFYAYKILYIFQYSPYYIASY